MPPELALFFCVIFILFLFMVDFRSGASVSYGLWIPLIWMMIIGSRFASRWMDISRGTAIPDAILEGSPLDMYLFSALIILAFIILLRRNIFWSEVFRGNRWILGLLLYACMSVIWSDYSYIAFKRWIKELGNIIMALIVITEDDQVEAIKRLIRRVAYVLIPLSIVLYKYYPALGRIYHRWSGETMIVGVTTHKNELGLLSMICGVFFLWDIIINRREKNFNNDKMKILSGVLIFIMTLWLLIHSDSATSLMGFIFGSCIMIGLGFRLVRENLKSIDLLMLFGIFLFFIFEMIFGIHTIIIEKLGREATLTGRVYFWNELIEMIKNPIFGTGYESFWLGPRLEKLMENYWWYPNQAHNGYLEVYLNLGIMGIILLAGVIVSVYGKIRNDLINDFTFGRLLIVFWGISLLYNITEASFQKLHLMWFIFLIVGIRYSPPYKIGGKGERLKNATAKESET